MPDYLLTFELSKDKNELYICTDITGLENLITELTSLLRWSRSNKTEHIHLMTEEWGGHELSSQSQIGEVLNHVKVYCWNEEQMAERTRLGSTADGP